MFELAFHSWYEPIFKVSQAAQENEINLILSKLGETIVVNDKYVSYPWWEEMVKVNNQIAGNPQLGEARQFSSNICRSLLGMCRVFTQNIL